MQEVLACQVTHVLLQDVICTWKESALGCSKQCCQQSLVDGAPFVQLGIILEDAIDLNMKLFRHSLHTCQGKLAQGMASCPRKALRRHKSNFAPVWWHLHIYMIIAQCNMTSSLQLTGSGLRALLLLSVRCKPRCGTGLGSMLTFHLNMCIVVACQMLHLHLPLLAKMLTDFSH